MGTDGFGPKGLTSSRLKAEGSKPPPVRTYAQPYKPQAGHLDLSLDLDLL